MSKSGKISRADFMRLEKAKGHRVHGALFSLSVFLLSPGDVFRCACVVSKKVTSKAVERNRIKRWCREAVRMHAWSIGRPLALVFRAKKEASHATFRDVERDVHSLVEKLSDTRYNTLQ